MPRKKKTKSNSSSKKGAKNLNNKTVRNKPKKKESIKIILRKKSLVENVERDINETEIERQIRLAMNRERSRLSRANENEMVRQRRLKINRDRTRERRDHETVEQREARLASNRERSQLRRLNMSEAEKAAVMEADKESHRTRRKTETEAKRLRRLAIDRERQRLKRKGQHQEKRERRLHGSVKNKTVQQRRNLISSSIRSSPKLSVNFEHLSRSAINKERSRLQKFTLSEGDEQEIWNADQHCVYTRRECETETEYAERLLRMKNDWGRLILQNNMNDDDVDEVEPQTFYNNNNGNELNENNLTSGTSDAAWGSCVTSAETGGGRITKDSITILLEKIRAGENETGQDETNNIVFPEPNKTKMTMLKNKLQLEKALWILKQIREKHSLEKQQTLSDNFTIADQMKEMFDFIKDLSGEKLPGQI